MAIGSNTLGLLFKIGVDAGDAQSAFRDLMATNKEFAKGVEEGIKAEMQSFAGLGSALKGTSADFNKAINQVNDFRQGLQSIVSGNIGSGIANLGKSMGGVGLAIAAALAALAVQAAVAKKAFDTLLDTAKLVGTESKEDFDKLRESIERVGGTLTSTDHAISQGITRSLKDLDTVFTSLITGVMRLIGPPLIVLIQNIGKEILLLKAPLEIIGELVGRTLVGAAVLLELLRRTAEKGFKGLLPSELVDSIKAARKTIFDELSKPLPDVLAPDKEKRAKAARAEDDPVIKLAQQRKELADAIAKAEKQTFDDTTLEIQRQLKEREISLEEATTLQQAAADRYRKALQDQVSATRLFNDIIFQAEEKRKQTRLEQQIADQEDVNKRIDNQRKVTESEKRFNADLAKIEEDRLQQAKRVADEQSKIADAVVRERARAGGGIPGGGVGVPGLPDPSDVNAQLDAIHQHIKDFFEGNARAWADNANLVRDGITGQIDLMATLGQELENLKGQFVDGLAKGIGSVVEQYVILGKTGPAVIKRILAETLASIAAQAAVQAIYATAYGFLMLAFQQYAEAAAAFESAAIFAGIAVAAGLAGRAVAPAAAGAGAGGFGGTTDTTPSQVNIGLGGANTLAISNAQFARAQIDAINNLNNKISSMSPGDVVTVAADQKPEAFATGTLEAGRRNGAFTREFMQISGARA